MQPDELDIADERAEPPSEAPEPDVVDSEAVEEPEGPEDFKPPETALEVRGAEDVYRAMDRADEELILDELQGKPLEVYVYDFGTGKKRVTDLTVAGVNEAVRLLNERGGSAIRISSQQPVVEEFTEDGKRYVRVMVYAEDGRGSHGAWGVATEPLHMEMKNGEKSWDKFAATKALNKAERNAKKKMIPEEFRQTIIATARQEGKVKELKSAAAGDLPELPPPLEDEKADELREKIRAAFRELQEINRMALPPARFNAYMTRAEHSHERLEDFLAHVEGLLAEERKKADDDAD